MVICRMNSISIQCPPKSKIEFISKKKSISNALDSTEKVIKMLHFSIEKLKQEKSIECDHANMQDIYTISGWIPISTKSIDL